MSIDRIDMIFYIYAHKENKKNIFKITKGYIFINKLNIYLQIKKIYFNKSKYEDIKNFLDNLPIFSNRQDRQVILTNNFIGGFSNGNL